MAKLTRLKFLNLSDTPVSRDAIAHLKQMKSLEELNVASTNMLTKDIAALRIALPKVKLIVRPPPEPLRRPLPLGHTRR